jgi:hypothetical protein
VNLPPDVNEWHYETVLEIVASSTLEPYEFDFKATVHPKGPDADQMRSNIRKCACAMANSDGGFIIFGVVNKSAGLPDDRIVGIESGEDWSSRFDEHAKAIRPQIPFTFTRNPILLRNDPSKCIFVVQIPRSPRLPHEFDGRFYRRNHGGSADHMSALEVRDLMLFTEGRLSKLTLLRIELAQIRSVCGSISMADPVYCGYRFEISPIPPLVAETCGLFPPGNKLLKDLSSMVTQARYCNELLDQIQRLAWLRQGSTRPEWINDVQSSRYTIDQICKVTEEELDKVYGAVKP